MERIFKIKCLHTNEVMVWLLEEYLEEINRDRSVDWVEITVDDIVESRNYCKDIFEEARYYELIEVFEFAYQSIYYDKFDSILDTEYWDHEPTNEEVVKLGNKLGAYRSEVYYDVRGTDEFDEYVKEVFID